MINLNLSTDKIHVILIALEEMRLNLSDGFGVKNSTYDRSGAKLVNELYKEIETKLETSK